MTDRRGLAALSESQLAVALRDLGPALAVPSSPAMTAAQATDPARLARLRIEAAVASPARGSIGRGRAFRRWRLGRSLALALIAVAVLAAIAGAIGLGLPGIRIVPGGSVAGGTGPATGSPSAGLPTASRPLESPGAGLGVGAGLGLGTPVAVGQIGQLVDFPVSLPADPAVGPPAAAWLLEHRLTLAWPAGPALPALPGTSVGLLLSEFRGSVDPGYFEKVLNPRTRIEPVTVAGATGWWISGEPHGIVFVSPSGEPRFDSRRIAGDTLLWSANGLTYRLESALGREATIRLAESLR